MQFLCVVRSSISFVPVKVECEQTHHGLVYVNRLMLLAYCLTIKLQCLASQIDFFFCSFQKSRTH